MDEAPKFEEGLAALEKLVAELEAGELGLEEALKRFETGVRLAGDMRQSLEETGRRIEILGGAGAPPPPPGAARDGSMDESEPHAPGAPPEARSKRAAKPRSASGPTLF